MRSSIALLTAVAGLLATGATASAQTGTTTTNTSTNLTKDDFKIELYRKDDKDKWIFLSGTTLDSFFNRKRCECGDKEKVLVKLILQASGRTKVGTSKRAAIRMRAGDQSCVCQSMGGANACNNDRCVDLGSSDLSGLANTPAEFETTVQALFAANQKSAADSAPICDRDTTTSLYVWLDSLDDTDNDPDLTDVTTQIVIDGRAPPAPGGLTARGGNDALQVTWSQVAGIDTNFQGYQVLCARDGDKVVFNADQNGKYKEVFKASFDSPAPGQCTGDTAVAALTAAESESQQVLDTLALMRGGPPAKLAALDPAYVCSNLLTSGTSTRLFRLQNDIPYVVGVVAIDKRRNASPITEVVVEAPTPTRDFYAGYRADGGGAEGGYCSVARGRGGEAGVSLLTAGAALLAVRRRGRRRGGRA